MNHQTTPTRLPWEAGFDVGHETIDAQHRALLRQCERLADHWLCNDGEDGAPGFDETLEGLKALVREHLETEAALRQALGDPDAEDQRTEHEEFDYLVAEIVTTENFDRLELQRFVALWCLGHVTGSAAQLRACLPAGKASPAAGA